MNCGLFSPEGFEGVVHFCRSFSAGSLPLLHQRVSETCFLWRTRMKHINTLLLFATLITFTAVSAPAQNTGCFAHHPQYIEGHFEVSYTPGCTGHDEPELQPVSSAP